MTRVDAAAPEDLELFLTEEFWTHGAEGRANVFRRLRDDAPVCFMEEPEIPNFVTGPGFWSVTRHEDLMHVSRHPDLFCSGLGTNIPDLPIEIAEFMGSMINMDAPRHTRLRMIVNRAFTPRRVAAIDRDVHVKAREILTAVADKG
jgi:methyl-branched lipid omega-hydroxylase